MPLRVDNTEITKLYVDGKECKVLYLNGEPYFGKKYDLYDNGSQNVNFSLANIQSPYQRSSRRSIEIGRPIYEGDKLWIYVSAANDYYNPKLFVDIGDGQGEQLRSNPFTFTVVDDVAVRGTAESTIIYTNNKMTRLPADGSLTIPGMTSDIKNVLVSVSVVFMEKIGEAGGKTTTNYVYRGGDRQELPFDVKDNDASVHFSRDVDKIVFESKPYKGMQKGVGTDITPIEVMFMYVRRKV